MNNHEQEQEIRPIRGDALYRQEAYIDMEVGEIKCLVPVTVNNVRDTERKMRFFSSIMIQVGMRPMPVNFEIVADTLALAVDAWPAAAKKAGEEARQKIDDHIRSSRLVVPSHARQKPN